MPCCFRRVTRDLLYALLHRHSSTYHGLWYTSCGALAGKVINSAVYIEPFSTMGQPGSDAPTRNRSPAQETNVLRTELSGNALLDPFRSNTKNQAPREVTFSLQPGRQTLWPVNGHWCCSGPIRLICCHWGQPDPNYFMTHKCVMDHPHYFHPFSCFTTLLHTQTTLWLASVCWIPCTISIQWRHDITRYLVNTPWSHILHHTLTLLFFIPVPFLHISREHYSGKKSHKK